MKLVFTPHLFKVDMERLNEASFHTTSLQRMVSQAKRPPPGYTPTAVVSEDVANAEVHFLKQNSFFDGQRLWT